MNKTSFYELTDLRTLCENEKKRREEKYSKNIKMAEEAYNHALKIDYVDEYREKFDVSLASLEDLYAELLEIYRTTKGLEFSITNYIKTVKPRPIKRGMVDEHFDMLVEECQNALEAINNSYSPEEDIEPIKIFCQGLIDLRYIVANARKLIEDTGNTQEKKRKVLEKLQNNIDKAKDDYKEKIKFESFDCYKELIDYRNKLMKDCEIINDSMLSNRPIKCRNDFKFLMGFYTENIPENDLKFAINTLGVDSTVFSTNPIFFELKPGHTSLLINAPSKYFGSLEFDDLVRNIYFSMASNLPAKDLLLAGVEHESVTDSIISSLENKIKSEINDNKSEDGIYKTTAKKDDEIVGLINDIKSLTNLRSTVYITNKVRDIFAYNKLDSLTTDYFILYIVNHYPYGFNPTTFNAVDELKRMANENGNKGVITVICQATDAKYSESMPMLKPEDLNADLIEIKGNEDNYSFYYNGRVATLNICAPKPHFDEKTYWKNFKNYFKNASTVWYYDLVDKFNFKSKEPYYDQISIPVGFSGGAPFEFSMDNCTTQNFGIITGKSGSGKSSFLHTLILSAANKYSPDELRIRLVDFKSEKDSPEFSLYKKKKGVDNLYIPHVDYLLVNGKPECALDLFDMIENIKTERGAIMNALDCSQFNIYNKKPEVLSGQYPKLPFILYIIDEYNIMIEGRSKNRSSSVKQKIITAIESAVRSVRSYGVGILLSGQSISDDMDEPLKQMDTRIGLMNNSVFDYKELMGKPSTEDANIDLAFLRGQGYSVFSTNAGKTRKKVRHAYTGNTGCDEQKAFTKRIREKYPETNQIVAGSENLFSISEEMAINEVSSKDNSNMNIPIGVASASMSKICLQYSTAKDAMNYFAFADVNKLFDIERNAIFGYLNEMANIGNENKKVIFLADNKSINACLKKYLDAYPELSKYFTFRKSCEEIAREIADIHDLYLERIRKERNESCYFEPIFVVFHDIEWLTDSDTSWVEMANEEPESDDIEEKEELDEDLKIRKEAEKLVYENKAYAKFNESMKKQVVEQMIKQMSKGKKKTEVKTKRSDRSNLSSSDYLEMLKNLYLRGNRYGIYMLVGSENFSPINKAILNQLDQKEGDVAKNKFSVYGSEYEKSENIRDNNAVKECVYVCPTETKTRLYDYDISNNLEFWTEFIKKLK